jgi:hypothetical protein
MNNNTRKSANPENIIPQIEKPLFPSSSFGRLLGGEIESITIYPKTHRRPTEEDNAKYASALTTLKACTIPFIKNGVITLVRFRGYEDYENMLQVYRTIRGEAFGIHEKKQKDGIFHSTYFTLDEKCKLSELPGIKGNLSQTVLNFCNIIASNKFHSIEAVKFRSKESARVEYTSEKALHNAIKQMAPFLDSVIVEQKKKGIKCEFNNPQLLERFIRNDFDLKDISTLPLVNETAPAPKRRSDSGDLIDFSDISLDSNAKQEQSSRIAEQQKEEKHFSLKRLLSNKSKPKEDTYKLLDASNNPSSSIC